MNTLKFQRQALRLSQSELARRSGVARPKICLYELGGGSLTGDEQRLIRLALEREHQRLCNITPEIEFETNAKDMGRTA